MTLCDSSPTGCPKPLQRWLHPVPVLGGLQRGLCRAQWGRSGFWVCWAHSGGFGLRGQWGELRVCPSCERGPAGGCRGVQRQGCQTPAVCSGMLRAC